MLTSHLEGYQSNAVAVQLNGKRIRGEAGHGGSQEAGIIQLGARNDHKDREYLD